MLSKRAIILCILLACFTGLSGCAEVQTTDGTTAGSNNMAGQDNTAIQQGEASQQAPTVRVKSIFKTANVRSAPSFEAPLIAKLPGGAEVAVIGENRKWYKVEFVLEDNSRVVGWMSKLLVE